jgi:hypothetical protein
MGTRPIFHCPIITNKINREREKEALFAQEERSVSLLESWLEYLCVYVNILSIHNVHYTSGGALKTSFSTSQHACMPLLHSGEYKSGEYSLGEMSQRPGICELHFIHTFSYYFSRHIATRSAEFYSFVNCVSRCKITLTLSIIFQSSASLF